MTDEPKPSQQEELRMLALEKAVRLMNAWTDAQTRQWHELEMALMDENIIDLAVTQADVEAAAKMKPKILEAIRNAKTQAATPGEGWLTEGQVRDQIPAALACDGSIEEVTARDLRALCRMALAALSLTRAEKEEA